MKPIIALCLAIAFLLVACSHDDNAKHEQFFYPTQPGTIWYYTTTQISEYDTGQVIDGIGTLVVRVAEPDTAGGVGQPVRLDVATTFLATEQTGEWYYFPTPTALHLVASCGAGSMLPQPKYNPRINGAISNLGKLPLPDMLAGIGCGQQPVDSFPDRPQVLQYPWRVGQSWVFRSVPELSLNIEKLVSKYAKVTVPAGTYGAYHVVWSYSIDHKIHVDDDFASIGLIRRRIVVDSLKATSEEHPTDDGYYTSIQETVLDSVKVPTD